jgi:hypothetical protein
MHVSSALDLLLASFLLQVGNPRHVFPCTSGNGYLLISPPGTPLGDCIAALDSLIYDRKISRYTQVATIQQRPAFFVLRPCDPGSPAAGNQQGPCETTLPAP